MKPGLSILFILLAGLPVAAQTTQPNPRIKTVDVEVPTEIWKGWETRLIDESPNPIPPPARNYTSFPTRPNEFPTFAGKVVGVDSFIGVEVSIVSVFPDEYLYNTAYEWAMVREDGSFLLSSRGLLDRPKTLCVRAPGRPWSFLRHDFPPGQSGRDIVMSFEPFKSVQVSARLYGGPQKTWMTVEAFDGYQRRDTDGAPVQSQYHGGRQSDSGTTNLILPMRPMALRVRADGSASACVIVDPRETDQLVVQLPREAILRGRVIDAGKPYGGRPVTLFNPRARLSLLSIETENDGSFELPGLMGGEYVVLIKGEQFSTQVRFGKTTEAVFDLNEKPAPRGRGN